MLKLYKILSVDTFTATLINKKKLKYGYIFCSGSITKKNIKMLKKY